MGNIFSATDIRGYVGQSFTTEYVWSVGKAFAEWLPEEGLVAVQAAAGDTMAHALIEGLLLQGRDVLRIEGSDQADIIAAITDNKAAGGASVQYEATQNLAVVTLFDQQGVPVVGDTGLSDVAQLTEAGNFVPAPEKGELSTLPLR